VAEYATETETWEPGLPPEDFLAVAMIAESLYSDRFEDPRFTADVGLKDERSLKADSADELRDDLRNVLDHEVDTMELWIAGDGVVSSVRSEPESGWRKHRTELRTRGPDHEAVYALHGRVKREMIRRFNELEAKRRAAELASKSGTVSVGAITAQNVSVSGTGHATSSSGPGDSSVSSGAPSQKAEPWWKQTWVVVVAPFIVAVAGGVVVVLIVGH
jgi:hypothetical protein